MNWETICATSQVSEDYPFGAKVAGKDIGVFLGDGANYAIENIHPHAHVLFSQGFAGVGGLEYPLHESIWIIRRDHRLRERGGHEVTTALIGAQGVEMQIDIAARQAAEEMAI